MLSYVSAMISVIIQVLQVIIAIAILLYDKSESWKVWKPRVLTAFLFCLVFGIISQIVACSEKKKTDHENVNLRQKLEVIEKSNNSIELGVSDIQLDVMETLALQSNDEKYIDVYIEARKRKIQHVSSEDSEEYKRELKRKLPDLLDSMREIDNAGTDIINKCRIRWEPMRFEFLVKFDSYLNASMSAVLYPEFF